MSNKTNRRKKSLQAFAKRRANRPKPTFVPSVPLKVSRATERRCVKDHADLLQNIEFTLVQIASESPEIDDQCIEKILQHAIRGQSSEEPLIRSALDSLATIQQMRGEDLDDPWIDALRVVYTSLKRHSNCESGELTYLRFVSRYVR